MIQMHKILGAALVLLLSMHGVGLAQDDAYYQPQDDGMQESAPQDVPAQPNAPQHNYPQEQIDQMVAPIALYPDPLLSQVLMASTYPLEIVEASRWEQTSGNNQLQGDALTEALEQQSWDPSVKSLVSVPQVLKMMNDNLQWTEQLGDAFLAQQGQVMDSVQHLRQMAQSSGHLASTPEQTVVDDAGAVEIQPANPQEMYVPYYNPTIVYGAWPYPNYAPYYFPPPGSVYATVDGIGFGVGIWLLADFWGWNHWDWHHHRIDIDTGRFASINRGQPPHSGGVWSHDISHRHNVPYANPALRSQYQGNADQSRRAYRGYTPPTSGRETVAVPHPAEVQPALRQARQQQAPVRMETPRAAPQRMETPRVEMPRAETQRAAPAFESFARGTEVRQQSQRGAYSRSTPQAAPAPRAAPARAAAPARGGGGGERGQTMRTR